MRVPAELWLALFRVAGGRQWPPSSQEEAERFLRHAAAENLLSLVFEEDSLPPLVAEARTRFSALWRVQCQRTELLVRALRRLAEILEGEELILLKGADYAFRLYPKPSLRPMGDIDLLVRASRMDAIRKRFLDAGMTQHFTGGVVSRVKSHHETVFTIDGVTVEPHQAFVQNVRHRIDYDSVWNRRTPFEAAGVRAFRLDDVDAVVYQTLRLAMDEFISPLIYYVDFYLLLQQFHGDLMDAAARAREWRTERALYSGFRQLAALFPEVRPRAEPLLERLLTPAVRRHLDRHVLPEEYGRRRMSRSEQLWRKFNLMDGYGERLRFLAYFAYAKVAGTLLAGMRHEEEKSP